MPTGNVLSDNDKLLAVRNAIIDGKPFSNMGYSFLNEKIEESSVLGKSLSLSFENKKIERLIRIRFITTTNNQDMFIVYVIGNDNKRNNVNQYLESKVSTSLSNAFKLSSYQGDFSQRVSLAIINLEKMMQKYMHDILSGKNWRGTVVDWGPYK